LDGDPFVALPLLLHPYKYLCVDSTAYFMNKLAHIAHSLDVTHKCKPHPQKSHLLPSGLKAATMARKRKVINALNDMVNTLF